MTNKKAWGIAAVVIAGAGIILAACFNREAADKPQEKSWEQQCNDAAARQHAPVLDSLCLATGYGPNARTP